MESNVQSFTVSGLPDFNNTYLSGTNGYWLNGVWYPHVQDWQQLYYQAPLQFTFLYPDPKEWLRGFLADKTHLTKDQLALMKKELGI